MLFLAVLLISRPAKDDGEESYKSQERYNVLRDHNVGTFGSMNQYNAESYNCRFKTDTEVEIDKDIDGAFGDARSNKF
jgi:hypothetical protein